MPPAASPAGGHLPHDNRSEHEQLSLSETSSGWHVTARWGMLWQNAYAERVNGGVKTGQRGGVKAARFAAGVELDARLPRLADVALGGSKAAWTNWLTLHEWLDSRLTFCSTLTETVSGRW
jgi:hypothetical protein